MKNVKKVKKLKAFTLVELIVVMVILALLMALVVPNVTKYIDKAGQLTTQSEAKACLTALQSFAAEKYGEDRTSGAALATAIKADLEKGANSEIYKTANIPAGFKIGSCNGNSIYTCLQSNDIDGSRILHFCYLDKNNKILAEYKDGKIEVK